MTYSIYPIYYTPEICHFVYQLANTMQKNIQYHMPNISYALCYGKTCFFTNQPLSFGLLPFRDTHFASRTPYLALLWAERLYPNMRVDPEIILEFTWKWKTHDKS